MTGEEATRQIESWGLYRSFIGLTSWSEEEEEEDDDDDDDDATFNFIDSQLNYAIYIYIGSLNINLLL
jgi:hypothetical protein